MAYAIGILALMLGMGCMKRSPTPSIPDEKVVDLAAWVPEEMEGFVVVSSLEAVKASAEEVKLRSSWEPLRKVLETLQEKVKEGRGLDLFDLSMWQGMGIHTQAPLMLASNMRKEPMLFAVPVSDEALFLAAFEKHFLSQGEWEAQPDMPQGLRAWKMGSGDFVVWAQKPGYALILVGDDLEVLQKTTQLAAEKSWAKHKEMLSKISSRLSAERVLSLWVRPNENRSEEVEWVGLAFGMQPRMKVVVDVTWRQGEEALVPAMKTALFKPKQWPQGLGDAVLGIWSSATWDWYTELLQHRFIVRMLGSVEDDKLDIWKQHFESPVLLRGWMQTTAAEDEDDEDSSEFHWSLDVLLKEGKRVEQSLSALASLLVEDEVAVVQADSKVPVWQAQVGEQKLLAQDLGKGRAYIADSLHDYEPKASNVLQKAVMKEMVKFPVAAVFHLNGLMKDPFFRSILGKRPLEKAEYVLFGLRTGEGHAQLVGEHFVETDFK